MSPRRQALERVLADLPPATEKLWVWPKPRIHDDGSFEFSHPQYSRRLEQVFDVFRTGAFGFAVGDKKALDCLDAWSKRFGKDPFIPENAGLLDREACLLLLRYLDRQERFCDGAWASAHQSGLIHEVLKRLIELED